MGVIQSKKDGVINRYEIPIDLNAPLLNQILELTNWCFKDIKDCYDTYTRLTYSPFVDLFIFNKLLPFSNNTNKLIFTTLAPGQDYVNIFQLICLLILFSHNHYRKKLQFLFVLFDFTHAGKLTNRELMLIFQSMVNGFCRATGQKRPKHQYLTKYATERYIRVNTLQAFQKVISYRRLIEEVQGNTDCFQLFKRFNQQIYTFIVQESYLFKPHYFKKYDQEDLDKIYCILKKVNIDKNYEELQMIEKNRQFRLQNRKTSCIKHLIEEKEEKFKKTIFTIRNRTKSMALSTKKLPALQSKTQRQSLAKLTPHINEFRPAITQSPKHTKVLFLNGKIQSKEDIFQTIRYFKNLSGGKTNIRPKQFFNSFEKKNFIKKQIGSLFKYFDKRRQGQVNFQDFLKVYYPNISKSEIEQIRHWQADYKNIHEADHFVFVEKPNKKEKKSQVQLPHETVKRMQEIFNSIDLGRKGHLTLQDLKKAYSTGFTIKQLEDMIRDFGKNGKIYLQQFIKMTLPQDWMIQGTQYVGA